MRESSPKTAPPSFAVNSPSLDLVAVVLGPDQQSGHVAQHAHQLSPGHRAAVILLPATAGDTVHLKNGTREFRIA